MHIRIPYHFRVRVVLVILNATVVVVVIIWETSHPF